VVSSDEVLMAVRVEEAAAPHSDETQADTTDRRLPTTNRGLVMYHSWVTVY
jgi:hypothetical protein